MYLLADVISREVGAAQGNVYLLSEVTSQP